MPNLKIKDEVELTDATVIRKLRRIVEPDGKKGTWLRFLDDKQLAEVYYRLRLNHSLYHVLKIVQKDWGIFPKSEPRSLHRALKVFRSQAIGLLKDHEMSYPQTEAKKDFVRKEEGRAKRIIEKVDGIKVLSWLVTVQQERIETMLEREKVGLPVKGTDVAMGELRESTSTLLTHMEELGLIDVKPKEWNLNLKARFDGLLENVIHDDGSRLISAANRFLELAEKKALTMRKVGEGKYEPDERTEG